MNEAINPTIITSIYPQKVRKPSLIFIVSSSIICILTLYDILKKKLQKEICYANFQHKTRQNMCLLSKLV